MFVNIISKFAPIKSILYALYHLFLFYNYVILNKEDLKNNGSTSTKTNGREYESSKELLFFGNDKFFKHTDQI
jgi:hypothetical protein